MIPSSAVREYMERKLDNHLWVKELSRDQLQGAIDTIKPLPDLCPDLLTHQMACFLLGVSYPKFCFWLDMGTGKTLIALELLRYWWRCKRLRRALIFVKSDKAFPTWEKQINRFNIDIPYTLLEGSSDYKWCQLDKGSGLYFISYPGATAMVSKPCPGKNKWKLDDASVKQLGWDVNAIVLDESTAVANHGSLIHCLVERLGRQVPIRYALAGRPFGRDPTMLWAQHYLIDDGATLGPTLGMFRAAMFTDRPNPWVSPRRQKFVRQYAFDKRHEKRLSEMIQHRSIAYAADECIDVPDFTSIVEEVFFSQEAAAYYKQAIKTIIEAKNNMRLVKNIFLRMRQMSSGFLGFIDDETGARAEVAFEECAKFDLLLELITDMPRDRKAVVFYAFTWSGRRIAEALKKMGVRAIWLWSGTKDYKAQLKAFEEDPRVQVAVVQNQVGAYSLDGLQVANYTFFYESPVSVIDREQAERRLRRQGQKRKVFQYDLITHGSMDARILAYHKQGEDLLKALLRDPRMILNNL